MAKIERGKKYQTKDVAGLECLNCTLPVSVCCGNPPACKIKYEKVLNKARVIKFEYIVKLQRATIRLFEAQDEDYPDGRTVGANERAIKHWLSLMTGNAREQRKILDIVETQNWNTEDCTYTPICDRLRAMGFEIVN